MFQSISLEIDSFLSPNSPLLLVYLPVVLGLLLHLGSQFKEPTSLQVILPLIALNALQAYLCHNSWGQDLVSSLFLSARSTLLFVITALSSIAVYRLGFHPLKKFPGPIKFSLSKWFMVPVDLKGKVSAKEKRQRKKGRGEAKEYSLTTLISCLLIHIHRGLT